MSFKKSIIKIVLKIKLQKLNSEGDLIMSKDKGNREIKKPKQNKAKKSTNSIISEINNKPSDKK